MTRDLHFDGVIKNVSYNPQLTIDLSTYEFSGFNINAANSQGIIRLPSEYLLYSKWESPAQSVFFPFGRIYNTYKPVNRRITIVPVLKDNGIDGRHEQIDYSTLSWMNLANVYIVFTYFDKADGDKKGGNQKLINQQLNNDVVISQIERLIPYHSSAIHWNRSQFGDHLKPVYKRAIHAYEKISESIGVEVHPRESKLSNIGKLRKDCRKYEGISIDGLKSTDIGKDRRLHENKYEGGNNSVFYLIDGYGGIYYLTVKDVWRAMDTYVIQETRFAGKGFLPPLNHIWDGLFRLIFIQNVDTLYRNGHRVRFQPRLTLLGNNVNGTLYLPCKAKEFDTFVRKNKHTISDRELDILHKLRLEVKNNQRFVVEIAQKLRNLV